jgi:hypothetical protein
MEAITMSNRTDVSVENHGSIVLFRPLTPKASAWIDENVQDDAQYFGSALVVEPRYAGDLAQGMVNDGLAVR